MASSTAIAWMCISLLVIYVLLIAIFGDNFGIRRRAQPAEVRQRSEIDAVIECSCS